MQAPDAIDYSLFAAQAAPPAPSWLVTGVPAEGVGVNKSTIVDLESNKRVMHETTRIMVIQELLAASINFTENGVVPPREWPLKPYVTIGIASKMSRPTLPSTGEAPRTQRKNTLKNLVSSATGQPWKK